MLTTLHRNAYAQLALGVIIGIAFGFLLQKSGVTNYDVIVGQLLLNDFTVTKMMLSAVIVGMIGFHLLKRAGLAQPHVVTGSIGSSVYGGLIFGLGFALLGYCPGTVAGAAGQGALDALAGGFTGILIGAGLFARFYPFLNSRFLHQGKFKNTTLPEFLKVNEWLVIIPAVILLAGFLLLLEYAGL
ncbi:MAG: YeeE/YedE thiosulfate transporter family protein [Methanoregula sp.]|nr:MAG: YeeE/YedE thiosulfate transporter family protein [Methanoregula sp.]